MDKLQYIGPLGIPLLILSLMGLAVIFERILFYSKLPKPKECNDFKVIEKSLKSNSEQSKNIRDELVTFLLIDLKNKYEFGIKTLRIISVISPMVGLLGTVVGIIESFEKISKIQGPVYPALIAEGLWTAMLTTAAGLTVALPCMFAAFFFARMGAKRLALYQSYLNKISLEIEGVKL